MSPEFGSGRAISVRRHLPHTPTFLARPSRVDSRLRSHVRWAVEHGSTRDELEALVTLLAVYCGFPRASTGMEIVRDELDQLGC